MENKSIKITKYYDRDQFTYEEKVSICKKTDEVCSHCGKKMYIGYGATVDHFIPLNKGGSNRMINLIPLCKDCNNEKEDKLYTMSYVPYLKEKYKKELSEYLDSYVQVMDYVHRHRLLAYDEYDDYLIITPPNVRNTKKMKGIKSPFKIKLATWNDLDKIHEYLVRYLKKNNCLDSEEAARENVIFWMQFGCIYYIERNNEIAVMTAMTIKQMEDDETYCGIKNQPYMYIFPYYNTDMAFNLVKQTIFKIALKILDENNLEFIPLNVIFLEEENMQYMISARFEVAIYPDVVNGFNIMKIIIGDGVTDYNVLNDIDRKNLKTYKFFKKFDDITKNLIEYFKKYSDRKQVSWMINSILSRDIIKESELNKYMKYKKVNYNG